MKKFIFVTFQKEGIHSYPAAPEGVEFLASPHRHMFHFRVDMEVFHNDRDLEFILVKRKIESWYAGGILQLDYRSCETMADCLYEMLTEEYGIDRRVVIEVSEDGENGAKCYYPATVPENLDI